MERMMRARGLEEIVIATTSSSADDAIETVARSRGWALYRGSEDDVLGRYAEAAAVFEADAVARMTMDCPLIDPTIIDQVIEAYQVGSYDFVANNLERSFPHGLDLEVFSRETLDITDREATEAFDREHVSPFVRAHPYRFRLTNVRSSRDLGHYRWTVDYVEDLELVRSVYNVLYREGQFFSTDDVLGLLERCPEIARMNAPKIWDGGEPSFLGGGGAAESEAG